MADTTVSIGADLGELRRELAKLPNLGADAAQKTLMQVERAVKNAEKAAKKEAKDAEKALAKKAKDAEKAAAKQANQLPPDNVLERQVLERLILQLWGYQGIGQIAASQKCLGLACAQPSHEGRPRECSPA